MALEEPRKLQSPPHWELVEIEATEYPATLGSMWIQVQRTRAAGSSLGHPNSEIG